MNPLAWWRELVRRAEYEARHSPPPYEHEWRAEEAPRPDLNALVRLTRVDFSAELTRLFRAGRRSVTIGIGDHADIPLLDADLMANHVRVIERRLTVVEIAWDRKEGFSLYRDFCSFGVFVELEADDGWVSLGIGRVMRNLPAGAMLGLGSHPAESLKFTLPDLGRRAFDEAGDRDAWVEDRFRTALLFWRYDEITFGDDESAVIDLVEPRFAGLSGALVRSCDDPARGMLLHNRADSTLVRARPGAATTASIVWHGAPVHLTGTRNSLFLGALEILLPEPQAPQPRFSDRQRPTREDLSVVFGIPMEALADSDLVRARYRDLVRRLHPDRNAGNVGHLSRFLEVVACWEGWQRGTMVIPLQ